MSSAEKGNPLFARLSPWLKGLLPSFLSYLREKGWKGISGFLMTLGAAYVGGCQTQKTRQPDVTNVPGLVAALKTHRQHHSKDDELVLTKAEADELREAAKTHPHLEDTLQTLLNTIKAPVAPAREGGQTNTDASADKKENAQPTTKGEKKESAQPTTKGEKKESAQPTTKDEKKESAQPTTKDEKKESAQPTTRDEKKDSAQPTTKDEKKDSAQPTTKDEKKETTQSAPATGTPDPAAKP
jgi:hypothetical protein